MMVFLISLNAREDWRVLGWLIGASFLSEKCLWSGGQKPSCTPATKLLPIVLLLVVADRKLQNWAFPGQGVGGIGSKALQIP